jgi:hypothetical protein
MPRRARVASWPLITGICTSISTASKGRPAAGRLLHGSHGFSRPSSACATAHAPALQHGHRDHHVDGVVLHHQHARAHQHGGVGHGGRCTAFAASAGSTWRRRRPRSPERQGRRVPQARPRGSGSSGPEGAAQRRAALCTPTSPPISSASSRQIDKPQPGAAVAPGGGLVGLREGREQARPRRGVDAHAGVAHLDAHTGRTASPRPRRACTCTWPCGVNLSALLRKLLTIWRTRSGSPSTGPATAGPHLKLQSSGRGRRGQRLVGLLQRLPCSSPRSKGTRSTSSLPASILDRSRMSAMMPARACALSAIWSRYWRRRVFAHVGHAPPAAPGRSCR